MLYIPKIDDYLKVFTEEKVNDFAAIKLNKYFKSIIEEEILEKFLNRLISF